MCAINNSYFLLFFGIIICCNAVTNKKAIEIIGDIHPIDLVSFDKSIWLLLEINDHEKSTVSIFTPGDPNLIGLPSQKGCVLLKYNEGGVSVIEFKTNEDPDILENFQCKGIYVDETELILLGSNKNKDIVKGVLKDSISEFSYDKSVDNVVGFIGGKPVTLDFKKGAAGEEDRYILTFKDSEDDIEFLTENTLSIGNLKILTIIGKTVYLQINTKTVIKRFGGNDLNEAIDPIGICTIDTEVHCRKKSLSFHAQLNELLYFVRQEEISIQGKVNNFTFVEILQLDNFESIKEDISNGKPITPTAESKPTTPTDTEPKPTAPTDTEPKPTAPTDTEPKPTAPTDTESKPTAPTDTEPKPTAPTDIESTGEPSDKKDDINGYFYFYVGIFVVIFITLGLLLKKYCSTRQSSNSSLDNSTSTGRINLSSLLKRNQPTNTDIESSKNEKKEKNDSFFD